MSGELITFILGTAVVGFCMVLSVEGILVLVDPPLFPRVVPDTKEKAAGAIQRLCWTLILAYASDERPPV